MTQEAQLKACPFCGGAVEDAFENLWDNDEGEIEKCWTVLHSCPVLKTNVWAHADSKAEAIAAWNTRIESGVVAELKEYVVAFGAPWVVQYSREFGLPDGHLHPTHYDILEKCGARMNDFTRAKLEAGK